MAGNAPATGCYRCGRVGHWSRDCPYDPKPSSLPPVAATGTKSGTTGKDSSADAKPPKSRKRPKLTADLLLSEKGLGYVLEKLPHMIEIKGRGHELEDLNSLLAAYRQWHCNLFPSFSFKRFIEEVEGLGSVRRVRMCLEELRDKVANGVDLKACSSNLSHQQCPAENEEDATVRAVGNSDETRLCNEEPASSVLREEQKARMEANRLKALERAQARRAAQQQV